LLSADGNILLFRDLLFSLLALFHIIRTDGWKFSILCYLPQYFLFDFLLVLSFLLAVFQYVAKLSYSWLSYRSLFIKY
jgi:hypothetical protein